jgi:glycosyltransferase involved in cell wall biosynthesis
MRNLAELNCHVCKREFYGELPAGHALHTPLLLECATGRVHGAPPEHWSVRWLADSYAHRSSNPVAVEVDERLTARSGVLLNCIDGLYGHALLKLLNAAPGDIVLVQRSLHWLVPDDAAAVWTVELPFADGPGWNDALAAELRRLVEEVERLSLAQALPHPHPSDVDIERFSRVRPFLFDEWDARRPTVTYIWRPDRTWSTRRALGRLRARDAASQERANLLAFAASLREKLPDLSFAVAGIGPGGDLPPEIDDLRVAAPDEAGERALCERYADSHVVVGVHGSNMLLPSAHAAAVVELMPPRSWGNVVQDLLPRGNDVREALYRYRVVPSSVKPRELAGLVSSLVLERTGSMQGIGSAQGRSAETRD